MRRVTSPITVKKYTVRRSPIANASGTAPCGPSIAALRWTSRSGCAGALASGLHHARRSHGAGFCTFNGLALATIAAIDAGARRVLVLDLDAHCGGGTDELVGRNPKVRILDVAVDITFLDTATNYRVTVRNGVLVYRKLPAEQATAQATITFANKMRLLAFAAGDADSPGVEVTGDKNAMPSVLAVVDRPDPGFNIIEP